MVSPPRTLRGRLSTLVLAALASASVVALSAPTSAAAAPVVQAPPAGTGYSLCLNTYYRNILGKESYQSKLVRFVTDWRDTTQFAKFLNKGYHVANQKKSKGKFYAWSFGPSGVQNCTSNVDLVDWRVEPGAGVLRVVGRTTRANILIQAQNQGGTTICETRSAAVPGDDGGFPFVCEGPFTGVAGSYEIVINGTARGLRPFVRTAPVTIASAPDVRFETVTPNPTTGPVTVGGTASVPSAPVVVSNPDSTTLCQTVSATVATNGRFPWSCNGTVSGAAGTKVLTAVLTAPGGGTTTATLSVVKSGATPTPSGIRILSASASPNPTTGPVTVSGATNRASSRIVVRNADGSTVCTTTGAATADAAGRFGFSCQGALTGAAGQKTLTVRATGPNGGSVSTDVDVNLIAGQSGIRILSASASPNPTTGPVTVSGATNRASSRIVVRNADGSTVCTTTGAATANAAGRFGFSCSGSLTGATGTKSLTVRATGPNGGSVSTTVDVRLVKTSPSELTIVSVSATPDPTRGPVTISGTSNRPGVSVLVRRPGGVTLCTTTGSSKATAGVYAFSCSGTVTGSPGQTINLTVKVTGPNGNHKNATVPVTIAY